MLRYVSVAVLIAISLFISPPNQERTPANAEDHIVNSIGMHLRLIPSGSYIASPGYDSEHSVTISKPFYIGVYEVTQEQYQQVVGENPSVFSGSNLPVETVTWLMANEFCQKLSELEGVTYRLPTEAEWEYAARAGTTTDFYWGDDTASDHAWYYENSKSVTHPVGLKKPNSWGLHGMVGNLWEWCADWYGAEYYATAPQNDPTGPTSGTHRVIRGASWLEPATSLKLVQRGMSEPLVADMTIGFRVVREIE